MKPGLEISKTELGIKSTRGNYLNLSCGTVNVWFKSKKSLTEIRTAHQSLNGPNKFLQEQEGNSESGSPVRAKREIKRGTLFKAEVARGLLVTALPFYHQFELNAWIEMSREQRDRTASHL
jgi:hypothetical protein